jgi:hypothetical protein
MFPEISRRCLVCGASARAAARFCPQCGGELAGHEDAAGGAFDGPGREGDASPPTRERGAFGTAGRRGRVPPTREHRTVSDAAEGGGVPPTREVSAYGGEAAGGETRRVRAAARVRGVADTLKPRVGKLREEALVVFDETPDDSGLRFVVIACGLFLVFLVFLLVSLYVLG